MRFESLTVRNFRAIRHFEITDLADVVLIAGPNGCGKSAALDAVRLLKSLYGGYQYDEWRHWFGEFQIDLGNPASLRHLLREPDRPLEVTAFFSLHDDERDYLRAEAEQLLEPMIWRRLLGRDIAVTGGGTMALSTELREHGDQVRQSVKDSATRLRSDLEANRFRLSFRLDPDATTNVSPCLVADVVFQTYEPRKIGVIEYHSAARAYVREGLGGVNLNLDRNSYEQQRRAHSLYNWQNKFQNVKTELASHYIQEIFARESGTEIAQSDLNETLKDLFQTFFPDKTYNGPRPTPDGKLEFPVRLSSGETHDIDDLSSGEKEILYGYLRLRNSAPQNSIVLLDEPELHLNPGLLQGLADFYHRNLGRALNNQLWLVTHSDALLRQAVGNQNFSAFHLRTAPAAGMGNQALRIQADDELDRAVIDLVGDLATYKPNAKVVILEGGGDTEFDVRMVSRLFPEFAQNVNLVSGGGKRRVRDLYDIFSDTAAKAGLSEKFYAIVDRDSAIEAVPSEADVMEWDRYHIESYLLEPRFILSAIDAVSLQPKALETSDVLDALKAAATALVHRLVLEKLQSEVNRQLVRELSIGASNGTSSPAQDLLPSIKGSAERLGAVAAEFLESSVLQDLEASYRDELELSLETDKWQTIFPGRLVLNAFVDEHVPGVNYEAFRNLILDQMVDDRYVPQGMEKVLSSIDA